MKIKLYIVTYNNPEDLHRNLESLEKSDKTGHDLQVTVINNYKANFNIAFKANVLHNYLRPDWSTGHLSRNWNQAIINGFVSLRNPDCDILIHCQDDTLFEPTWVRHLVELHQTYTFVQCGVGDNFCSYTPDGVKEIGLWDERFCGIGYQEADYFIRARADNRSKSTINDHWHGRVLNPHSFNICRRTKDMLVNGKITLSAENMRSSQYHPLNKRLFWKKWGVKPENWEGVMPRTPKIQGYMYYPYFEMDINLSNKNYFCDNTGDAFGNAGLV